MTDLPKYDLICCMARNRVIGANGQIPWHFSIDMRHFRRITAGRPLIMGRRTAESLPGPLKGRQGIVVMQSNDTSKLGHVIGDDYGFWFTYTFPSALQLIGFHAQFHNHNPIVIGGARLYREAIEGSGLQHMFLTTIDRDYDGDTYFPEFDEAAWEAIEDHRETVVNATEDGPTTLRFRTLIRKPL